MYAVYILGLLCTACVLHVHVLSQYTWYLLTNSYWDFNIFFIIFLILILFLDLSNLAQCLQKGGTEYSSRTFEENCWEIKQESAEGLADVWSLQSSTVCIPHESTAFWYMYLIRMKTHVSYFLNVPNTCQVGVVKCPSNIHVRYGKLNLGIYWHNIHVSLSTTMDKNLWWYNQGLNKLQIKETPSCRVCQAMFKINN